MAEEETITFGKLRRGNENQVIGWHSLPDHMTDVAVCFRSLADCRGIRRALEATAKRRLTPQDIARLAVLVFLHDIGKANSGFQAKRWRRECDIPPEWPVRIHAGHGSEVFRLFDDDGARGAVQPLIEKLGAWGDACDSLLIASISHHGSPVQDRPGIAPDIWRCAAGIYDPCTALREIAMRGLALFPLAFEPAGEPLPDNPSFGHLFAGLIQLADWLGSDTRFFPFSGPGEDRAATAEAMADKAIMTIGLDMENWRDQLVDKFPSFSVTFHVPAPRPIQTAMQDSALGPLVILESETGSGKTEAALWRYLHLFSNGLVDGLYFALPTRAAASQIFQRVTTTLHQVWPDGAPLSVRALPGYISADGASAIPLPDFKVLWEDDLDQQKAPQRWAAESAKRFLAAPVAVGTIDQALLGALQVRHAHLRYATLARSLLVVDEVHASDAYMTVLLEQLLKAHLDSGGHAILLSATLGSSARSRYQALVPGTRRMPLAKVPFDTACAQPYPAISDNRCVRSVHASDHTKPVRWVARDIIDTPDLIAELAIAAARHGAKVLIIRNTVPAAIAALTALEAQVPDPAWLFSVNGVHTLHHSRFSRQDRPVLDAAIEASLGKHSAPGPLIVVGTQTLEQSLDIDADFLITDLCPMDVLLQRIGRLHRHHSQRPDAYQIAQVLVLTPTGNDLTPMLTRPRHGLGRFRDGSGVYSDLRILEATRAMINSRPEIAIPRDNRELVESATHLDKLVALETQMGESWQKLGQQIEGDIGAQKSLGRLHALDIGQPFGEPFPVNVEIATRLGAQDRLLHFHPFQPGPFGHPLQELPIRHYLLPNGLSPDEEPCDIQHYGQEITFRLGDTRFRYSRLGVERLQDD